MEVVGNNSIYNAGVYCMETRDGKKLYYGSALEINDAISRHLYALRRGYYYNSNKRPLQEAWDRDDLVSRVEHVSASSDDVRGMDTKQKESLQIALGELEQFYINLYASNGYLCNKHKSVTKHTSNKNRFSTYKRKIANMGANNPNSKYDEELVANILYFKQKGLKPKEIIELLLEHDINVNSKYIPQIGVTKWVHLEGKCPDWYKDEIAN